MPRIKVLISGAGVAGNALAFWLSKLGTCDITVVERFPTLRTTGLQIDLRAAGIDALRKMGLEEAFRARAAPEEGIQLIDRAGQMRAFFPANKTGKGAQSMTSEFEIMRGDLCRLMYDATDKAHTRYLFGTSIESFEEKKAEKGSEGGVDVRFANGMAERFDLVVGADGVGSKVRKVMLGVHNGDPDPSFFPKGKDSVAYFTAKRPIKEGEDYRAMAYIAPDHKFVLTRRHSPEMIQVYLMTASDLLKDLKRGDIPSEKAAFDKVFRGAGWITDELLDIMLAAADDFYCDRQGLVKMPSWSSPGGGVALLGDAGFCPTANGFGTSAAMAGAYIMAGEIARHCGATREADVRVGGLKAALQAYEGHLKPFMDKMQKGEESERSFMPTSWTGIAMMHYLISAVAFLRLDRLGMMFAEVGKGLKLPDYSDVIRA